MHGHRFWLLLLATLASGCNDSDGGDEGQAAVDTCSTENVIDDIDDGVSDEATAAQAAPADLSY